MFRIRHPSLRAFGLIGLLVAATGCTHVTVPLEPPMTVRRGDEAFRYQDYASAVEYYQAYLDRTWQGDYTAVTAYQCALAEYRLKRYQATITTLNDLEKRYPDTHWVQVQALRGDAERAQGNDTLALLEWDEGWDLGSTADQEKLRLRIVTLAKRMPADKLASARPLVQHDEVRELLYSGAGASPGASRLTAPMPEFDEAVGGGEAVAAVPPPAPRVTATPSAPARAAARADDFDGVSGKGTSGAAPSTRQLAAEPATVPPQESEFGAVATAPTPSPARSGPTGAEMAFAQANKSSAPRGRGTSAPSARQVAPQPESDTVPDQDAGSTAVAAAPVAAVATPSSEIPALGGARVGVLLPMSGRNRDLGERAWRAIQLAFGDEARRLVLKDTGGDSSLTRRALNELWRDQGIVAVVGPVTSADAEAVAELAEQDQLPLLPLSQADDLNGRFVLQVGMTRAELVGSLLDYAVGKARLHRYAVLYPDDASGRAFLETFRGAVAQRGGTIVGTGAYPPGANVVPRYSRTLAQWRAKGELEALFLADASSAAADVASFLQDEIPDVTLLGVQGWAPLAGEVSLTGVLFADGFFAGSVRPATRAFVQRYQEAYGQTPGGLEARAHDAGILARRALDAGAATRSDMIRQLRALGEVDGATGVLRVTPSGLQRSVFLLRVYKGALEEIGVVG